MKAWQATFIATLLMTIGTGAQAGVVIGGTRVIYDGAKKEASININNPDKGSYLIQSWVDGQLDSGHSKAEKAPFIVTPPLFRLDGEQQNILRVVRAGGDLPTDKESLYWMNIKSIPSAEKKDNTLLIAVKTRIKLIYRPVGLKSTLEDTAKTLTWKRSGNNLQVTNPTPHYFTFYNVSMNGTLIKDATMVAPKSTATFALPANALGSNLSWQYINDWGGTSKPITGAL